MTIPYRLSQLAVLLGLMLSGCASPRHSESPHARASSKSTSNHAGNHFAQVVDRTNDHDAARSNATADEYSGREITLEQFKEHVQNDTAVVIDARDPDQFAQGHIRRAINVPPGEIQSLMPQLENTVSRYQYIIVYCSSSICDSSKMVYEYLTAQGYSNVHIYSPGWKSLASAKDLQ